MLNHVMFSWRGCLRQSTICCTKYSVLVICNVSRQLFDNCDLYWETDIEVCRYRIACGWSDMCFRCPPFAAIHWIELLPDVGAQSVDVCHQPIDADRHALDASYDVMVVDRDAVVELVVKTFDVIGERCCCYRRKVLFWAVHWRFLSPASAAFMTAINREADERTASQWTQMHRTSWK